jgi:hypothetical protein
MAVPPKSIPITVDSGFIEVALGVFIALLILVRYRDCRFEAGGRRQEEVHLIILKKVVSFRIHQNK